MPKKKGKKDEENRLQAIDDNGFVSNYWYDAAGERTVKTSGESQQVYVNSVFSGGDTQTADFTAYINPYLVVSKGGQYTKHIYIGSQRIVSKLGDLDSYGSDPRRIEYAGANVDGANVDYATKYESLQQTIKDRYATFEVPYNGVDNDDYVNGQGFCCVDTKTLKSFTANGNDNPELFQYYYHSDHLGSSSLITNLDGEIVQHIEYVPFGEVFIEERNNTWNTPYLFNAKELDEETGLYYYGARYYDPRVSLWLSTDPLQEKYPNMSSYVYCGNNPVNYIDPDGKWGIKIHYTIASNMMKDLGYDSKTADRIAYFASTYADQPPRVLGGMNRHLYYGRYGTRKGDPAVANSQNNDENSWRHAMMSDTEFSRGETREWAINRTIGNAWNEIFKSIEGGNEKQLGVGLHALQDISAHGGISNNEHLGVNESSAYYIRKDMGYVGQGDQQEAYRVTKGVMSIYGVLTGNQKVIDNLKDKNGVINIDLTGVTNADVNAKIFKLLRNLKTKEDLNVHIQF